METILDVESQKVVTEESQQQQQQQNRVRIQDATLSSQGRPTRSRPRLTRGGGPGSDRNSQSMIIRRAYDETVLHRAIEDAGRWAYGTVVAELWVLNAAKTHLIHPSKGWWIDSNFHNNCCGADCKLCRLTDNSRSDYLEPSPVAPGVGLPGALWSAVERGNLANNKTHISPLAAMGRSSRRLLDISNSNNGGFGELTMPKQVTWRELQPLANDPHQPWDPRLKCMAEIGLGYAAGVPFEMGQEQGIVVFVARDGTHFDKLTDEINEEYLTHATLLIGAAYSLRGPRHNIEIARKEGFGTSFLSQVDEENNINNNGGNTNRKESDITDRTSRDDSDNNDDHTQSEEEKEDSCIKPLMDGIQFCKGRISMVATKFFGANVNPPPAFNWEQTVPVLLGVLVTLLALTNINRVLIDNLGQDHAIVLGPIGALLTLQYGLTAAPAAQPQNIVIGQLLAVVIGNTVGSFGFFDAWHKETIGVTLTIVAMVKLGVTHPPAGASAMIFSSGKISWMQALLFMGANIFVTVMGALLINLSEKRQYPTFWGFGGLRTMLMGKQDAKNNKK